jgi:hypothetical protein
MPNLDHVIPTWITMVISCPRQPSLTQHNLGYFLLSLISDKWESNWWCSDHQSGFPPEMNLKGGLTPLMSFMHLRMLNSASKCHKLRLKLLNFQNQKQNFKKTSWGGYPPLESFDEGLSPCERNTLTIRMFWVFWCTVQMRTGPKLSHGPVGAVQTFRDNSIAMFTLFFHCEHPGLYMTSVTRPVLLFASPW